MKEFFYSSAQMIMRILKEEYERRKIAKALEATQQEQK